MREWTVIIIYAAIVGLVAYDIYAITHGGVGDSISAVMLDQAKKHPILPFSLGVLIGHLYFSQG